MDPQSSLPHHCHRRARPRAPRLPMHSCPTSPTASREAEPRTVGAGAPPEWCGTPHPTTTLVAGLHQRRAGAPDRRLAVVGRLARILAAAPPTPVERACAGTPHRPRHQRHPPQHPALTLPIGKNASRRQSGMHRCPRQDRRSRQRRRRSRDNGGRQRRAARRSRRRDPLPSLQWVQRPCRSRGSGDSVASQNAAAGGRGLRPK